MNNYFENLNTYQRIATKEVIIGNRPVGGANPVRLQSMTNTDTNDVAATVEQCIRIVDAGGDYVRITAQGVKEAETLNSIKQELLKRGYTNPIVADIHFNPKAAEVSAQFIEKVRINPGNYTDKRNAGQLSFSDEEYTAELDKIRQNLKPLLDVCREKRVAIRIGVNHGSLSQRVMSRYGDTPLGLVMSLIEFLHICRAEDFHQLVLSIKASNTRVMLQACRLLVQKMKEEGFCYPVHLGVTEAGEGEDGRLKSAAGIGTLLVDGIGDTVRVSLTEAPEAEIPVARKIVDYCAAGGHVDSAIAIHKLPYNPFEYTRRQTIAVNQIGGGRLPIVIGSVDSSVTIDGYLQKPDYLLFSQDPGKKIFDEVSRVTPNCILPYGSNSKGLGYPLFSIDEFLRVNDHHDSCNFVKVACSDVKRLSSIPAGSPVVLLLEAPAGVSMRLFRAAIVTMEKIGVRFPVVLKVTNASADLETFQVQTACDAGGLFLDGLADGIWIESTGNIDQTITSNVAFGILQATRARFTRTEFISCPSCGRTLFDIQTTVKEIRQRTGHLSNLKIGIMGCIVNGPGEMADADYGYVGAGRGLITLYKDREVVKRNIPEHKAVDELIELIKVSGDWKER